MMADDCHELKSGTLSAIIAAEGAELQRLDYTRSDGIKRPMLWAGIDPWPRHSPVLFPIVGKLPNDRMTLDGQDVHMKQHGFARNSRFAWVERTRVSCVLELRDSEATQALFPRQFILQLRYAIEEDALRVSFVVHNPGEDSLPVSIGAHPAFAWPIIPGIAKTDHRLVFAHAEPEPVGRLREDGLHLGCESSPIVGNELLLSEDLFVDDALILEAPHSRSVRFETPEGQGLEMSWEGLPSLGLWMKPGGDFLCIEPWHGYATPAGFEGDFKEKPGLVHVPPNGSWKAYWKVRGIG